LHGERKMHIGNPQEFFRNFPNLDSTPVSFAITSEATGQYNCIAWAMGDPGRWWWPSPVSYWPQGCPMEVTIHSFGATFEALGYSDCPDGRKEEDFEKVALYARGDEPTHVARQLPSGEWTSKIGANVDIEHKLEDLEGPLYGKVVAHFRRIRNR